MSKAKRVEINQRFRTNVIKINLEDDYDSQTDDILKDFKEKFVREKGKKHKTQKFHDNDLYEDKDKNDSNNQKISILKDKGKSKDKKGKGVGFTDIAKKMFMNQK